MWQASILVRALVHGWRHMGGAHTPVESVTAALAIGLDSSGSPSALSVPPAPSTDPAALGGLLRCSALLRAITPAVATADHRKLGGLTRTATECEPATSELVQDHHSKRQIAPGHLG